MSTTWYFIQPTDSLFVRGNLAFGEAGEHGSSLMPPPPSLFAGALRSAILGRDQAQLRDFVNHGRSSEPRMDASLGSHTQPGAFRLSWLSLAVNANDHLDALLPLPADLLWLGDTDGLATLKPQALPAGVACSGALPLRAVLNTPREAKPEGGRYLRLCDLRSHLTGTTSSKLVEALVKASDLYQRDARLGIGLDTDSGTAADGHIYTTEGFAFRHNIGFLVGIKGMTGLLPAQGHLRLGGDGRSAVYRQVAFNTPQIDTASIDKTKRFRLILQTPGLFEGWLPPGVVADGETYWLRGQGFSARLVCAAVGRREVVSGWDLHVWAPKKAESAAPAGSVYWFDSFEGNADRLAAWATNGLRVDTSVPVTQRHAEGWNQALLAHWPHA
ncbi:MAG: type III-B CRISPR module-associated Cmr3 family protein [Leptothrix ochracea]|uniref:type III-B CRISPR module-associated Cmr3 family protein n=1 Tax=Leptothrix ochracea TaxID=735331 RepID=UPI0034E2C94D